MPQRRTVSIREPALDREGVLLHVLKHQKALIGYAFGYLKDWAAAEDAVHETILVVSERWQDYRDRDSIFPWARGITRNKCLQMIRARCRVTPTEDRFLTDLIDRSLDEAWGEDVSDELAARIAALRKCLGRLTPRALRLLRDFYIDGTPGRELAEREGLNFNNLRSQLHRLRHKVRDCVEGLLPEDSLAGDGWELLDTYYTEAPESDPGARSSKIVRFYLEDITSKKRPQLAPRVDGGTLRHYLVDATAFHFAIQRALEESDATPISHRHGGRMPGLVTSTRQLVRRASETGRRHHVATAAAAAALVVGSVMGYLALRPETMATFATSAGTVELERDDRRIPVSEGLAVLAGDRVVTGPAGRAVLDFGDDGTRFELSPNTSLGFPEETMPLNLERGRILADVAKRRPGDPLRFSSSDAEAIVMGTVLDLEFRPQSSLSRLEVAEGRVRLHQPSSGISADVDAGFFAEAAPGLPPKATALPEVDLHSDLVAAWNFETEDDGTVANLVHGAAPLWLNRASLRDGALVTGGDAFADADDEPEFRISGALTLSAWVRESERSGAAGIISKYAGEDSRRSYALKLVDGHPQFILSESGRFDPAFRVLSPTVLPIDTWCHVAAVFTPGESMRIYIDGNLVAENTDSVPDHLAPNDAPLWIGLQFNPNQHMNVFNGRIDEVRIYSRALSERDLAGLFEETSEKIPENLQHPERGGEFIPR